MFLNFITKRTSNASELVIQSHDYRDVFIVTKEGRKFMSWGWKRGFFGDWMFYGVEVSQSLVASKSSVPTWHWYDELQHSWQNAKFDLLSGKIKE